MDQAMQIDSSSWPIGNALAMAYVPMQQGGEVFSPAQALRRGSLFRALEKPFTGKRQVTGL